MILRPNRQGQISIDYLAGAFIFFGAVVILISSVMNTLPGLQNAQEVNRLELTGWGASEVIMQDPGYWESISSNGSDWHRSINQPFTHVVGLQDAERDGISLQKVRGIVDMDPEFLRQILGINSGISISFTELVYIDTYLSFQQGSTPSFIVEPGDAAYTASAPTVRYGTAELDGTRYYVLRGDDQGWYNNLWIGESWDFTEPGTTYYNLTQDNVLLLGNTAYFAMLGDNSLAQGRILTLRKRLGRAGSTPSENADNVAEITRFGVTNSSKHHIVKAVFRIWS